MKILHPTDFSDCSDYAWQEACKLAKGLNAELILLHVFSGSVPVRDELAGSEEVEHKQEELAEAEAALLQERHQRSTEHGVNNVRSLLEAGVVIEEIQRIAEDEEVDMIVIGTHGRGGLSRFFIGSVADKVIRTVERPVLTVRIPAEVLK